MGIQGLLPLLKDIQKKTSVSEFKGQSVGIDGYCWLHKGVYGCAKDVVEGRKTNLYINYVLRRINMLLNYNIKPVMVFDGGYLPAKASKEKERRRNREENLTKAKSLLRAGRNSQANEYFQRCVEITPAMATEVIQACREKNVLCVVAPYEADAQLAYLEMQKITDFTISEDSDLLIYGCKRVLFKMNSDGDGVFINLDELNKVKTVALESFTMEKFRHMCILSGCDYLPSIKGLGLYKAHKYLRKSTNVYKAIQLIKQERKFNVPEGYAEDFRKTDAVFKYQSVFDPRRKTIVRLNQVSENESITEEELQYAGPNIDEAKAVKIALGNLDPISGETLGNFDGFLNNIQTKEPTEYHQKFFEKKPKSRDLNLHYSLDNADSHFESTDTRLEEVYFVKDVISNSDSNEDAKKELSPPEKRLQNIHLYPKEGCSLGHSSSSILYKDQRNSGPFASRFGHHSVFVKRKHCKLKNPFRVHEAATDEEPEDHKSRYFSCSQDGVEERENFPRNSNESLLTKSDEMFKMDSDRDRNLTDNAASLPDSKRVKLSFVEYLDTQSKTSLQHDFTRRFGREVSPNHSRNETGKCSSEMTEISAVCDESSLGLKTVEMENRDSELAERNSDAIVDNETFSELCSHPNSDIKGTNSEKFSYSMETLPPLPSLFSFASKDAAIEMMDAAMSTSKTNILSSRLSLFKYNKQNFVGGLKKGSKEEEKITGSRNKELEEDEEKVSSLHLEARSFSEPILRRQSSCKTSLLLGKCKRVGLSRKSKSSLDRVREKDSKLTQMKIGFDRFSYTKRKLT